MFALLTQLVKALIHDDFISGKYKKKLDQEIATLRKLDPKLADEMAEYRKSYQGGLIGTPIKVDQ